MTRRDALAQADDTLWASLAATGNEPSSIRLEAYDRARLAALALGFSYKTLDELASAPMSVVVERLNGTCEILIAHGCDAVRGDGFVSAGDDRDCVSARHLAAALPIRENCDGRTDDLHRRSFCRRFDLPFEKVRAALVQLAMEVESRRPVAIYPPSCTA